MSKIIGIYEIKNDWNGKRYKRETSRRKLRQEGINGIKAKGIGINACILG